MQDKRQGLTDDDDDRVARRGFISQMWGQVNGRGVQRQQGLAIS
jgi:hypothetical protein